MKMKQTVKSVSKTLCVFAFGYFAAKGIIDYSSDSLNSIDNKAVEQAIKHPDALSDSDQQLKKMYQDQVDMAKSMGVDLNPKPDDYIKRYNMSVRNHDWMHACDAARILSGIYYDNSDEENYNTWAKKKKQACHAYVYE